MCGQGKRTWKPNGLWWYCSGGGMKCCMNFSKERCWITQGMARLMGAGKLVGDHLWAISPSLKHNRFPFGTVLQKYIKPQTNCLNNVFICQHLLSVDGSNFSRRRRSLSVNRFWTENGLVVLDPKLQETQVWKCSRHSASSTRGGTDQQNETVLQVTFLHWIEICPFQPVYRRVPSKSANSQIPQLCFCQSNKMHLDVVSERHVLFFLYWNCQNLWNSWL